MTSSSAPCTSTTSNVSGAWPWVRVRYPSDDKGRSGAWYNGVITAFNGKTQEHTILFNDGEDKLKLSDETFRIPAAP